MEPQIFRVAGYVFFRSHDRRCRYQTFSL